MKTLSGFTLIELVVTLAIMATVLMLAMPLTGSWVDSATVVESKALLQQAYSRTRATALANPGGVAGEGVAAYMCLVDSKIYVQSATLTTCGEINAETNIKFDWVGNLKPNVAVDTSQRATFVCMGMSNLGMPISGALNGATCTTDKILTVTKGEQSDEKTLY